MVNKEINFYVCVVIGNFIVHLDYEFVSKVSSFFSSPSSIKEVLIGTTFYLPLYICTCMYASFEMIEGQLGDENIKK